MKFCTALARSLIVGLLIVLGGSAAAQQAYPSKPIRLITPYPPGGSTDIVTRLIAQKLTESWGQQVIVDNRPGGNTIIGSEALVRSPPDGYTLLLTSSNHAANATLLTLPYDTIKDFAPVTSVTSNEYVLVLSSSVPANNLQEFIALAKSRPGQLNYAAVGTGTNAHLAGELFDIMTGTKMQHIPYKGAGQMLTDLVGGILQLAFMNPLNALNNIKTGQLKPIAITGETRKSVLPQVPTFTEAGLPGFGVRNWNGVFAPAGTPKEIINKLAAELARIMTMPDIKEKLAAQGTEPFVSTPDQFAALINAEIANIARIIKIANVKIGN